MLLRFFVFCFFVIRFYGFTLFVFTFFRYSFLRFYGIRYFFYWSKGRNTVKVVPRPMSDFTLMVPWWASTIFFT